MHRHLIETIMMSCVVQMTQILTVASFGSTNTNCIIHVFCMIVSNTHDIICPTSDLCRCLGLYDGALRFMTIYLAYCVVFAYIAMQFQPNPSLGTQWSLLQLYAVLRLMIAFGIKDKYVSSLNIHIKVICLFHRMKVNNTCKVLISTECLVSQENK